MMLVCLLAVVAHSRGPSFPLLHALSVFSRCRPLSLSHPFSTPAFVSPVPSLRSCPALSYPCSLADSRLTKVEPPHDRVLHLITANISSHYPVAFALVLVSHLPFRTPRGGVATTDLSTYRVPRARRVIFPMFSRRQLADCSVLTACRYPMDDHFASAARAWCRVSVPAMRGGATSGLLAGALTPDEIGSSARGSAGMTKGGRREAKGPSGAATLRRGQGPGESAIRL